MKFRRSARTTRRRGSSARRRRDQSQSEGSSPPGFSVRTSCTACASSISTCRRSASGPRTSGPEAAFPPAGARDLSFTDEVFGRSMTTGGPGTSASSETSSNSWSGCRSDGVVGVEHLPVSMRSEPARLNADRQSPQPGRRRVVRRACQARCGILGARLPIEIQIELMK